MSSPRRLADGEHQREGSVSLGAIHGWRSILADGLHEIAQECRVALGQGRGWLRGRPLQVKRLHTATRLAPGVRAMAAMFCPLMVPQPMRPNPSCSST